MKHYSEAAVERMMKVQEVIMRALAKKIRWYEAAEILGISVRQMKRRKDRWDRQGYDGLFDRRLGKPSPKRVPVSTVEEVLRLYQEQYYDFNVKHFHEQLKREHHLKLSYTWVKTALQTAGLVPRRGRRSKHRKRREPRPLPGMMLHIDGSKHQWFKDGCYYDLIVVLDDATNEIYYAQLVEAESTRTVMAAVRAVIEAKGLFCSLYCDRASHFFLTPKAGERVSDKHITQVGRALAELGIRLIPAYSPEARGRSERSFRTWQGRLPQELRQRGLVTLPAANEFLREHYLAEFNRQFARPAKEPGTAFTSCPRKDLDFVFALLHERTVARDNTVSYGNRVAARKDEVALLVSGVQGECLRTCRPNSECRLWTTCGRSLRPARSSPGAARERASARKKSEGQKKISCGNAAPAESDKRRRFPQGLGKVPLKSGVTFPHSHSCYY